MLLRESIETVKNTHQQYKETIDFLFSQLPMFQRVGKTAFKKDLTNIIALCKALDQPQLRFPSIHIAGTNGKGSTAHMLSAILQASGKKVGLYTSPHYRDFRERIKINGQLITKKYVVEFVNQHQSIFKKIKPSFFEITVALAFDYFAKQKVDVAIIETGLGGRLDSTNIIVPILSIITNISFDHQQFLGNTLPKIAKEKAGIIKKNIPVVIGEEHPKTKKVFIDKAKTKKAKISFASQSWIVKELRFNISHTNFEVAKNGESYFESLKVNLHGTYQRKNLATVLQAVECLKNIDNYSGINDTTIKKGLSNLKKLTRFMGRWQIIGNKPLILCDSAHNEGGLTLVMKQIQQQKKQQLHIVIGMVNDKSIDKMLAFFPQDAKYYFAKANIPRGLDAKRLQEKAKDLNLIGKTYSSVKNALRAAKRSAHEKDMIYVGGSTFVVAEVI